MALSPEEFVRKYLEAYKADKSVADLAAELRVSSASVATRVRNYRQKGVKLPALKNSNFGINPDELNKLIEGDA